jgi:hypothetical protein
MLGARLRTAADDDQILEQIVHNVRGPARRATLDADAARMKAAVPPRPWVDPQHPREVRAGADRVEEGKRESD